jgi:Na+/H+ antiporter NhaD/arsenite permease-like protein
MPLRHVSFAILVILSFLAGSTAVAGAADDAGTHAAADTMTAQHGADDGHADDHGDGHVDGHGAHGIDGAGLGLLWAIPFIGVLLSIAIFPLVAPHFWHQHFPKVSAAWALVLAVPLVLNFGSAGVYELLHIYIADYIPFIILLWALFTVSGGILVRGNLSGTPVVNLLMLLVGTAIASWIGTTGAAMLLIRPFMRANAWRKNRTYQVVFFIFLVCNIGGSLTPLGDPPLFLGFLRGVPFFWTMDLLVPMLFASGILFAVFFALDTYHYRRETGTPPASDGGKLIEVKGLHNLLFLGGIIEGVLLSGTLKLGEVTLPLGLHVAKQNLLRDGILIAMGLLSLWTTKKALRKENQFTWFPIQEVAYLFAGIFTTMVPVLLILKSGAQGEMAFIINAVKEPVQYFWITGILSSFLDNAPTYVVFFETAMGKYGYTDPLQLIEHNEIYLRAIATGAVFMGANTYIGNAPNFMVRSIAETSGISMPSFFGYILKYTLVFLVPVFLLVTVVFFL